MSQAVKYHRLCARRNCYAVLKGRRELFITTGFLTLCRDKIMLYNPTPVSHSLHGVADGNTNCAHGTVISRV